MGIEKLVEECGEEACQIIGNLAGGCFSPEDVCDDTRCFCKTIGKSVAEEMIRRTLEFAAGEIYPTHRRACACTRCDCGNSGDAQSVADWDARQDCSNHLRSLSPKAEG